VSAELYDRALELVKRAADELEALAECEIPVTLPDDLAKAWREKQALAETLKTLPPATRAELVPVYKEKLEEADAYASDALNVKGPSVDDDVLDALEALLEEDRRERLLAS
jgi:DNA-directed RNA polymerase specialized sigma24 family protein